MRTHADVAIRSPLILFCCAAVLAGCARSEQGAAEGTIAETAATMPAPAAATISLADVAGKWNMHSMDLDGGNVLAYELTAPADGSNWSVTVGKAPPLPVRVLSIGGDSIVIEVGPYESFIRKGVRVRQRDTYRLRDGQLVGTMEGWYSTPRGDSVTHRRLEGTRATIALADVAGRWKVRASNYDGSHPVDYVLEIPADGSNWSIIGGNRPPIPLRVVSVAGDSIVADAGPYESFILEGVQARSREIFRLLDGKLVSRMDGYYALPGGDSVSHRKTEGTRLP